MPPPDPVESEPEPVPFTADPPATAESPSARPSISIPGKVIAVLVAIGLLFVLGVSCSAIQGNDASLGDLDSGWAEALNGLIGRKPSIAFDDLSSGQGGCLQNGRLTISPGGACGYFIQSDDSAVRGLTLRMESGLSATVTVQQGDFSEEETLGSGATSDELDILPDNNANITISCALFGSICTLAVQ